MKPYTVKVADAVINTIRSRIKQSSWPSTADEASWENGTSVAFIKDVSRYWLDEYDWSTTEEYINTFSHYSATVNGTHLHFIYEKCQQEHAPTIMLLHGWPDSFYRFHAVIPLLKKTYNVVVPSLPGFGFSGGDAKTSEDSADCLKQLVSDVIGIEKFYVAAGDSGAPIAIQLARRFPETIRALYLTDVGYDNIGMDRSQLSGVENEYLSYLDTWMMSEGAYAMVHATKPQSLAFAMTNSPIGFAAWAASFANGGQKQNYVDTAFGGRNAFITNVMIYLVTNTINSSMQTYRESIIHQQWGDTKKEKCSVPVALTTYPNDTHVPKEWAERIGLNIQRYKQMETGGHFVALEQPSVYGQDVLEAFSTMT